MSAALFILLFGTLVSAGPDCTGVVQSYTCGSNEEGVTVILSNTSEFAEQTWNRPKEPHAVRITQNWNPYRHVSCCSSTVIDDRDVTQQFSFAKCNATKSENSFSLDMKVVDVIDDSTCSFVLHCSYSAYTSGTGSTTTTTIEPSTTPCPGDYDKDQCEKLKSLGYCTTNPRRMHQYCAPTCGFCTVYTTPTTN